MYVIFSVCGVMGATALFIDLWERHGEFFFVCGVMGATALLMDSIHKNILRRNSVWSTLNSKSVWKFQKVYGQH